MPSAFVRGYSVESLGGIFCLHVRDKSISCDGNASWCNEWKTRSAAEFSVTKNGVDTKINGITLQNILIAICKCLNQYRYPASIYKIDHTVAIHV
jgi:hypothetical protein